MKNVKEGNAHLNKNGVYVKEIQTNIHAILKLHTAYRTIWQLDWMMANRMVPRTMASDEFGAQVLYNSTSIFLCRVKYLEVQSGKEIKTFLVLKMFTICLITALIFPVDLRIVRFCWSNSGRMAIRPWLIFNPGQIIIFMPTYTDPAVTVYRHCTEVLVPYSTC